LTQVLRINFRHRQTMPAKMTRKFEEGDVFFVDIIENADRAEVFAEKPGDLTRGTAKLALEWLNSPDRRVEMLFKKLFENVHQDVRSSLEKWGPSPKAVVPTSSLAARGADGESLAAEKSKKALL
jgi:hypothetical protein